MTCEYFITGESREAHINRGRVGGRGSWRLRPEPLGRTRLHTAHRREKTVEEGGNKGAMLWSRGSERAFTLCATFVLHPETSEALGWREVRKEKEKTAKMKENQSPGKPD